MTQTTQTNYAIGDLIVRPCSTTGTSVGIIRLIDHTCSTPYFVEWLTGYMQGYTHAIARCHVDEWSKIDR
jgi:hypothetical protein